MSAYLAEYDRVAALGGKLDVYRGQTFPPLPEDANLNDVLVTRPVTRPVTVPVTLDDAAPWPALTPLPELADNQPPAFPFAALGAILGAAAHAIAQEAQAPDSLSGGAVLAAASLAVQPLANVVMPHGQRSPTSLYIVTAASSGDRKSRVDELACFEIEELRKRQARDYTRQLKHYEQDKASDSKAITSVDMPLPKAITTANATIEGLSRLLSGQSSVGVFSPDGGDVLGGHSLRDDKKAAGMAFFLKGWGGESLDTLRGGAGLTTLLGRRISMHLLIQPVLMRQLLTDPMAQGQGLIARMLTAQPQTLAGTRLWKEPTSQEASAITAYNATMRNLLSRQPTYFEGGDGHELKPRDLHFDEAASAAWKAFYNQVEVAQGTGRELEAARPWASKAAEQAARIAAVITMVQDPQAHSVGLDAMLGAIKVTHFYLNEHLRLTQTGRTERQGSMLRELLAWMQERGRFVPKKDVQQLAPRHLRKLKAAGLNELLCDLVKRGYIREAGSSWEVRHV